MQRLTGDGKAAASLFLGVKALLWLPRDLLLLVMTPQRCTIIRYSGTSSLVAFLLSVFLVTGETFGGRCSNQRLQTVSGESGWCLFCLPTTAVPASLRCALLIYSLRFVACCLLCFCFFTVHYRGINTLKNLEKGGWTAGRKWTGSSPVRGRSTCGHFLCLLGWLSDINKLHYSLLQKEKRKKKKETCLFGELVTSPRRPHHTTVYPA